MAERRACSAVGDRERRRVMPVRFALGGMSPFESWVVGGVVGGVIGEMALPLLGHAASPHALPALSTHARLAMPAAGAGASTAAAAPPPRPPVRPSTPPAAAPLHGLEG